MENQLNLKDIARLKHESGIEALDTLMETILDGLFHPDPITRVEKRQIIRDKYPKSVVGYFVGDNQVFLVGRVTETQQEQVVYLGDLPQQYRNKPTRQHSYYL